MDAVPPPPKSLDFLQGAAAPVISSPSAAPGSAADRLPPLVVNKLMSIKGVDGVWVEHEGGHRVVVLHYTPRGNTAHLPKQVEGMPTRIVGGEPIRALPAAKTTPRR